MKSKHIQIANYTEYENYITFKINILPIHQDDDKKSFKIRRNPKTKRLLKNWKEEQDTTHCSVKIIRP